MSFQAKSVVTDKYLFNGYVAIPNAWNKEEYYIHIWVEFTKLFVFIPVFIGELIFYMYDFRNWN